MAPDLHRKPTRETYSSICPRLREKTCKFDAGGLKVSPIAVVTVMVMVKALLAFGFFALKPSNIAIIRHAYHWSSPGTE